MADAICHAHAAAIEKMAISACASIDMPRTRRVAPAPDGPNEASRANYSARTLWLALHRLPRGIYQAAGACATAAGPPHFAREASTGDAPREAHANSRRPGADLASVKRRYRAALCHERPV